MRSVFFSSYLNYRPISGSFIYRNLGASRSASLAFHRLHHLFARSFFFSLSLSFFGPVLEQLQPEGFFTIAFLESAHDERHGFFVFRDEDMLQGIHPALG